MLNPGQSGLVFVTTYFPRQLWQLPKWWWTADVERTWKKLVSETTICSRRKLAETSVATSRSIASPSTSSRRGATRRAVQRARAEIRAMIIIRIILPIPLFSIQTITCSWHHLLETSLEDLEATRHSSCMSENTLGFGGFGGLEL